MKLFTITYKNTLKKEIEIRVVNIKADNIIAAINHFDDEKGSDYEIISIVKFNY